MGNSNLRNCINGQQLPPIFLSPKTEIIAEIYTDKDNLHSQIRILTLYIQCIFSYFFYAELFSYLWGNKKYTYFFFFFLITEAHQQHQEIFSPLLNSATYFKNLAFPSLESLSYLPVSCCAYLQPWTYIWEN